MVDIVLVSILHTPLLTSLVPAAPVPVPVSPVAVPPPVAAAVASPVSAAAPVPPPLHFYLILNIPNSN